ncbi:LytR/AlgR family response regulator transcription factor [Bifidobacterium phasiani]|uniref:Response regulator transcription factor n=1 Tax=Bifidobacterium phasiani TaxID=2834431 RepID=A0ABS6W8F8_9BIFI|nr:response regulator transcription factor [Bifidobacterium phasiani]MBW3082783.1 response regulator transcription factor [Bifidobacterium phasiani]
MRKVSIAVVDDDPADGDTTEAMVERYFREERADGRDGDPPAWDVARYADGMALLGDCDDSARRPYDILLLDIEMPGIDGLETARRLRARGIGAVILFTTKMAQYATVGYDVDAVGYLVKPLRYRGFALNMRKAVRIARSREGVTVPIASDDHMVFLDSNDIRYVEVLGHSLLYHAGNGIWKDWGTLKAAAELLTPHHFVASNRYCLVNLDWVDAMDGSVVTVDGERLSVSRSRKKPLLEALSRYYGTARTARGRHGPDLGAP